METVSLYSETRIEYLKQMSMWITSPLVEFFRNEYATILTNESDENAAMGSFQKFCAEVPKWNQDVVDANVGQVLDNCRCDYIEELMTAVFIAHTKMLTAIRINSRNKKLQITLPKLDHYIHRVFIECARSFWKSPYLFSDEFTPIERQKNILQAEVICNEALAGAVRSLLPVKSILKDYLEDDPEEKTKDDEEEEEADDSKALEETEAKAAELKAVEAKATEAKLAELKAAEAKAEELKAAEAKVAELKAAELKAAEAKAEELKAAELKAAEAKAEELKAAELKAAQANAAETKTKTEAEELVAETKVEQFKEEAMKGGLIVKPSVNITKVENEVPVESPKSILKPSNHSVEIEEKKYTVAVEKATNRINIETEPVVHFTPYDTVYDDVTTEIRYSPKVEDKWSDVPKLTIAETTQSSTIESIDLEPQEQQEPQDVDVSLMSTSDFDELL